MYDNWMVSDRIVVARLAGVVNRHAGWKKELTHGELADAVAELRDITERRADGPALMAEVAGLRTGTNFGIPLAHDKAVLEAQILVAAGADEWAIDGWTCIGAERAAEAAQPPFGARLLAGGGPPDSRGNVPRGPFPG